MDDRLQPQTKFASYVLLLLTVSVSTLLLAARIHDAFDPADDDPDEANEEEAPVPLAPEDALD